MIRAKLWQPWPVLQVDTRFDPMFAAISLLIRHDNTHVNHLGSVRVSCGLRCVGYNFQAPQELVVFSVLLIDSKIILKPRIKITE